MAEDAAAASSAVSQDPAAEARAEIMMKEVQALKITLDDPMSDEAKLLEALTELKGKGSLPTKVLSDTLIGKTVNQMAKASTMDAVREGAKGLVEQWRSMHRKRKAAATGTETGVKRSASTASLDDGPALTATLSQESLGQLSQQMSQDHADTPASGDLPKPAAVDSAPTAADEDRVATAPAVPAPAAEKKKMTPQREKVRQKILDALGKEENLENKLDESDKGDQESLADPVSLAAKVEEALSDHLSEKDYFNQARALIYNLKDKKNHNFRLKLLLGYYTMDAIPKLSAEDMASDEKNAERAKLRKYSMEEIQSDYDMKKGNIKITGMFTCGKCKGMKTTYFQMQTRSSDEPMTTFVTCLTCSNRWKFC